MALAFGRTELQFKKTGTSVLIPKNPMARLMYYLNCVCKALEMDTSDSASLRKLRDHENYIWLSEEEQTELLLLCAFFSPDVLMNKVFFQSDELCGDSSNEFYEIGAIRKQMVVSRSIVIGGQTKQVKKIMTFKMSWLRNNYLEPMQQLHRQLAAAQEARRRQRARRNSDCVIL